MIIALILAAMADFILFTMSLLLSFVISRPLRRRMGIATAAFAIPLIPVGYFIAVPDALIPVAWSAPRTLNELQQGFPAKRADLEAIVRMSDEDPDFSRVAPDRASRALGDFEKTSTYAAPDPLTALPRARWDEYRTLFARNGIRYGIERSNTGDVSIEIQTIGLFNRAHLVGYARCAASVPAGKARTFPCDHSEEAASDSFRRLDGAWFAYEE